MANERRIRLIQVAKEFNVGINTITDFLQKKGVKSDGSPNALVDAETYALLEKEFGAGRAVNSERVNIRERIAQKQATVTLDDDAKGKGGKNDEELLVKSNVISVKDEVADAFLRNVNDGTVEGLRYRRPNCFTVQFHPEAAPGPMDTEYLFDRFVDSMKGGRAHA